MRTENGFSVFGIVGTNKRRAGDDGSQRRNQRLLCCLIEITRHVFEARYYLDHRHQAVRIVLFSTVESALSR